MTSAVDYLRGALRELHASREELTRQIGVIERTLRELESGPLPLTEVAGKEHHSTTIGRSVRQIALELAEKRGVFLLDDLIEIAASEGNDARRASVSSMVSRMIRNGDLAAGPRRGSYALPGYDSNASAEQAHGDSEPSETDGGHQAPDVTPDPAAWSLVSASR